MDGGDMVRGVDGVYNERTNRDQCGIDHKGAEVRCGCTKKAKVGKDGERTANGKPSPTTRPVIGLDAFNLALAFCTPYPF